MTGAADSPETPSPLREAGQRARHIAAAAAHVERRERNARPEQGLDRACHGAKPAEPPVHAFDMYQAAFQDGGRVVGPIEPFTGMLEAGQIRHGAAGGAGTLPGTQTASAAPALPATRSMASRAAASSMVRARPER